MNRRRPLAAGLAVLLIGLPSLRAEGLRKLDPRIFAGRAASEKASFLVVMKEPADLSGAEAFTDRAERRRFVYEALVTQADRSQAALRARLEQAGIRYRAYYLVNMIEVEGDRALAEELAGREDVSAVAPDAPVRFSRPPPEILPRPFAARAAAAFDFEPNIAKIRAPEVWARGYTGQSIVVGVADTGFAWTHPALILHYRGFDGTRVSHDYNWLDAIHNARPENRCGSNAPAPCDDDGHGTATASLAVGDDGAGNRIGVAPGARFIGCRNMDQGDGTPARYTECFQFFFAPTDLAGGNPRPDLGADVISNSWGCPVSEGCTNPNILKAVVENVRAAGVFVAAAASNDGPACATIDIPAIYDAVFAVGATEIDDSIAVFSSRGPVFDDGSNRLKPDLCAPGIGLRAANISEDSDYTSISGTSASTPEVAGAVALLWSALPELIGHPDATAVVLKSTAVPLISDEDCGFYPGNVVPNPVFGYGRLDVAAAVGLPPTRTVSLQRATRPPARVVAPRP